MIVLDAVTIGKLLVGKGVFACRITECSFNTKCSMPIRTGMRIFLVVTLLLCGLKSWAFQYQMEAEGLLRPSLTRAAQFANAFEGHGLWSIRGASLVQAGMPFDFAYVNHNWDKAILVKEGLRAPADKMGVIFRDEKNTASLFHLQIDGSSYVVMALGFGAAELREVLAPFKPRQSYSKWSFLISSAQAMDTMCDPLSSAQSTLAASAHEIEDGPLLRTIGKCGMDAYQGMKQSAEGTLDFFKKLATNPSALWSEMKDSFIELKEFALNIKSELQNFFNAIRTMPAEQKAQVACTAIGELIMGVAQGALAAGALAKTLPLLVVKLRRSMSLLTKLGDLKSRGYHIPDLNLATKEILSCAY